MHMTKLTKVRVESEGGDETTNRRLSLVMVLRCQPPPKENKEDEEMLLISDNLIFGHMGYSDPLQKVILTNPFQTTRGPEYSRYWSIKWSYLIFVTGTTGGACEKKHCPV